MKTVIRMKDGFTFLGNTHTEVDAIGRDFAYKTFEGVTHQIANGTYDIIKPVSENDERNRPFGPGVADGELLKSNFITPDKLNAKKPFLESAVDSIKDILNTTKWKFDDTKPDMSDHESIIPLKPMTNIIPDSVKIIPGSIKIPGISMAQALENMKEAEKHWPSSADIVMKVEEVPEEAKGTFCEDDLPWIEDTDELRYFPDDDLANAEELKRAQALIRALRERSKRQGEANKRLNERLNKEVKEHLNLAIRTNEELKAELDSYVSDIETLKGEIRSHESAIEELVQDRDRWKKVSEDIQHQRDKYKAESDRSSERLKGLVSERDGLLEHYSEVMVEYNLQKESIREHEKFYDKAAEELQLYKDIVKKLVQ